MLGNSVVPKPGKLRQHNPATCGDGDTDSRRRNHETNVLATWLPRCRRTVIALPSSLSDPVTHGWWCRCASFSQVLVFHIERDRSGRPLAPFGTPPPPCRHLQGRETGTRSGPTGILEFTDQAQKEREPENLTPPRQVQLCLPRPSCATRAASRFFDPVWGSTGGWVASPTKAASRDICTEGQGGLRDCGIFWGASSCRGGWSQAVVLCAPANGQ
ncbi:hypothetical protein B0T18DRAFT_107334 [Schizothecium vesticola]|uniref:Uncharacterized protein n=1 Tax=Schizothecium vesticola TaxID=314040 RepID=A0AA40F1H9_9PEZI|nr:hypothetical protein B0T18DRAFT_107334 [Schizothecium vesticola]